MSQHPKTSRRIRVLLVAEAANPKLYSVSLIGWSFSQALSKVADVTLASELRNRADIEAAGIDGMRFVPIDNRRWQGLAWNAARLLRGGTSLGWSTYSALAALAYPFFERGVWRQFHAQLARGEFDVVHRITPNSPTVPSLLARKCASIGVPFVLGPINGGVPWPKEFAQMRRAEKEWLSPLRRLHRRMPGFHSTRRHSAAIMVAARCAWEEMPARYRAQCVYLPENAIDVDRFPRAALPTAQAPVSIAFVGRLVPLKGVDMLLEAAAPLVQEKRVVLDIIGDGPELPALRNRAHELGIAGRVQFPGWVEHTQMAARLGRSQIFAFPSVREFGGGVVLEAMARGLVPIVLNYGGPGELVPPGAGITIPMGPRDEIIRCLGAAISQLVRTPAQLAVMGHVAQDYVYRNFTWDAKARQILEVYRWSMKLRADKPDFGTPLL